MVLANIKKLLFCKDAGIDFGIAIGLKIVSGSESTFPPTSL